MSSMSEAVDRLFKQVQGRTFDLRDVQGALQQILQRAANAAREELDLALERMEELVSQMPLLPAALVAVGCGALIENGGSTQMIGPAIFQRTYDALQLATTFVTACQHEARKQPGASDPEDGETCVEEYGQQVSAELPTEAQGWSALELICPAASAVLMRDARMRGGMRAYKPFMSALQVFPSQNSFIESLRKLVQVLENEELVILHPTLKRGYRVCISGVSDNFQLHTLLADALIGDPAQGWLPGERPDPIVVAAAKDGPCPRTREENRDFPTARGAFNLWNWRGLQADGSLPTGTDQTDYWIWNEGVPADIESFEGTRVVLLGPQPYIRTWSAGRYFPALAGRLELLEVLSDGRASDWLARLIAARK